MNANDVLIDLLEDNRRRLFRFLMGVSEESFNWKPDEEANNIAVTLWHMGRLFDVFLNQQVNGSAPENENWFKNGWSHKTGYDPRGIGRDGWGSLNGYTAEQVGAIPRFSVEQLSEYINDVYDEVHSYLESASEEELLNPGSGFEGRYSKYQIIQMALMDNVRHLGELFTLQAMWTRQDKQLIAN